jgi:hypothetical protein
MSKSFKIDFTINTNLTVPAIKRIKTMAKRQTPFFRLLFKICPRPGIIKAEHRGDRIYFFIKSYSKGTVTNGSTNFSLSLYSDE